MSKAAHLNDHDLVRFADRELSASRSSPVLSHLEACQLCRDRLAEIESVEANAALANLESPDALPIAASRAALRSRLANLVTDNASRSVSWPFLGWPFALQAAALICGMLLIATATAKFMQFRPLSSFAGTSQVADVPNRSLTPGAVRSVSLAEVCAMPHEEVELDVPAAVRSAVFQEYGIANARPNDYEIDYLIAPGLGGTQDIHNLWPEPYASDSWNAHVKDSLEEYLHQSVCAGRVDLRTAQSDISSDWIAAYKKYFHTEKPIAAIRNPITFTLLELRIPLRPPFDPARL